MRWMLVVWAMLAGPALCETWSVRIGPVEAAQLSLRASEADGTYQVAARLRGTGLVRLVARIAYQGEVSGRVRTGRLSPLDYREAAEAGRRSSKAHLVWTSGVPRVVASKEDGPPEGPKGSVDPLTALWAVLRPGGACGQTLYLFDGLREGQLALGPATAQGDARICRGEYQRLRGFSDKDLAEARAFPLALRYDVDGVLIDVEIGTLFGQARLTRR